MYKRTQWSTKAGARRKGLSGLEGLLAIVGLRLEVASEGIRTGTQRTRDGGKGEFQTLGSATLKLRA